MNRLLLIATLLTCLTPLGTADASLHDRGNGLIYDDVLDITWLQDANYVRTLGLDADGLVFWNDAANFINNLVYEGFDDWRMPSMDVDGNGVVVFPPIVSEAAARDNELGYMHFYNLGGSFGENLTGNQTTTDGVTLFNIPGNVWSSTPGPPFPNFTLFYGFTFSIGSQSAAAIEFTLRAAWPVRDGDVVEPAPAVPEAASLMIWGFLTVGALLRRAPRAICS